MVIDLLRAALAEATASDRGMVQGPDEIVAYRMLIDQLEWQVLAGVHEAVADGSIEAGSGLSPTEWCRSLRSHTPGSVGGGAAGADVAGEDVAGEDVAGEDVAGEDVAGEDVAGPVGVIRPA